MTTRNVQSFAHSNAPGCPTVQVKVGDVVVDDLLSGGPKSVVQKAKVLEIWKGHNDLFSTIGIKLDTAYLDGLRHPWEITTLVHHE